MRAVAVLGLAVALAPLAACTPSRGTPGTPGILMREVDAKPVERAMAGIEIAFDATAAASLVDVVPDDVDFAESALLCLYLGERPTTGWRLSLGPISLDDGELLIMARENPPRGNNSEPQVTYPAECVLIGRTMLPPGELAIRAHDTVADEFIVSGSVVVPEPRGAP